MTARGDGLRVAQLVCTDAFAGVERYVARLSIGLARLGCEVTVLGGSRARMPGELARANRLGSGCVPGHRANSRAPIGWAPVASPATGIGQLLRHRRVDIVHSHMTDADLAAALTQRVVRSPVVSTRHFTARRGSSRAGRLAGKWITSRIGAQIAISEAVGHAIEGDYTVVRSGVPVQPPTDERLREPIVLVAQRLEAEKRTDVALDIWARSGLANLGWRLMIAGDGAQREALERHARSIDATAYEFLGERQGIGDLLVRSGILLAPCPVEALGLTVIEAMAMRVPVVAVGGGGHDETVGRASDARLFAPGDIDGGAHLLRELGRDAERRAQYGAELAEIQQRELDLDVQVRETLEVYLSLLR